MIREKNISLIQHNTFAIDAKAKEYIEYDNLEELKEIANEIRIHKFIFIGQGSNVLFLNDFDGYVIHSNIRDMEIIKKNDDAIWLRVGAGIKWDDFVDYCVSNNLYGVENLSYIPGEVGAAAVQNIGAYGAEVSDVIDTVEFYDTKEKRFREWNNYNCNYTYRRSNFKKELERYAIHHVIFRLSMTFTPNLSYKSIGKEFSGKKGFSARDIRDFVIDMRKSKLPDPREYGNAGSFFMNPIVNKETLEKVIQIDANIPYYKSGDDIKISAAAMIEKSGWKGKRTGNAGTWEKQPLVIVNYGGCKAGDIVALADRIRSAVYGKFGIMLQPEVQFI